ncbi:Hypothetical protein DHA2_153713 [Giardia duodenalis]|uniref:Golgi apparatus membrane protein TVP23 homolog n=1 Tax=Giardia intestinalis TaxID=5741 RepID=V6T843_GIAIN|nr:Hypothetical protein DHA2_153713 [Giardia intestinalis]
MDFDFNAPAQQAPGDPFALPQQSSESAPKKKRSKCNLEHVVVYSFFIILKSASPVLAIVMLGIDLGVVKLLPPAMLLTVMDEWFTHHIAGRRMVRLRYHIYGVDGKSYIHYEYDTQTKANKCEAITFWTFLWVLPLFWVIVLIINIVSSTIKIITFKFNATIILYAISQGIFSCFSIYKFMMTRVARSAKIREERRTGKTAPAPISAPQNNDYTAPQPQQQQQPDQFVF